MITQTFSSDTVVLPEERELLRQAQVSRLLLEATGGSLPRSQVSVQHLTTVLDVACGTGTWALDAAASYPHLHVTGMDVSAPSIAFAQRRASQRGLSNIRFLVQDMCHLENSPFEESSFDLIHLSFIASTVLMADYAALVTSLLRLCRPGGLMRWTEMELPITNSLAFEQFTALICRALDAAGQSFIPPDMQRNAAIFEEWRRSRGTQVTPVERRHVGITPMMGGWLRQGRCEDVEAFPVPLEVSAGTPAHATFVQQVEVSGHQLAPFLYAQGVTAPDVLTRLLAQVMDEIRREDFCGLCWLLTVHGYKEV